MTLTSGTRLGPYEIVTQLGMGGMGEVYRARDTRLDRIVAVKILPAHASQNAGAKERFNREARAVSCLNHPNICHLYDVGEQGGIYYLVMEYLEGETLAERLQKGAIPLSATLKIAIAVADALEAAHSRGIIHRDIKPANLLITHRDEPKVLDFGLAASVMAGINGSAVGNEPTLTIVPQLTSPGTAVGTMSYMSPEQARGEKVDVASDLFSFGVVLYEMTTGRRPFMGPTVAVVFDAILNRQPLSPCILNAGIPASLERVITRLLTKERSARFHTAHELLEELRRIQLEREKGEQPITAYKSASIAVLPFEDLSPDRSQQPFCEGMAAEIINALGALEGLRVISRTSAVRCREKGMDIGEIGQHLNVQTVLEGTVRRSGNRLRVTAQLVNSRDGTQMWSERYDRNEGDVFDIQEEIATAIVGKLKGSLIVSQGPAIKRPTGNIEAYRLYLKGRYYWERRNRAALQSAVTYFEQAISADPDYALAHSGLADCYTIMAIHTIRPTCEVHPTALSLALRALELDPELAEAHASLGAVKHFLEWDWVGAAKCYSRALELDSRLAYVHIWHATVLVVSTPRRDEAIAEFATAMKLEPDSAVMAYTAAINHYWARDPDTAAELIERALELEPNGYFAHWVRGRIYSVKGLHEEAISATMRAVQVANHNPMLVSALGVSYACGGRYAEAEELINELKNRSEREYIAPHHIAEIYLALNRTNEALEWFERAVEEHNPLVMGMAVAQHYDPLRNEPRFRALLRKINLPDE
jgi:serine/threonine protein kinase/tetratricopeptide (TPR) repeat protein